MQEALHYEDLELAVATLALLLELPLQALHLVGGSSGSLKSSGEPSPVLQDFEGPSVRLFPACFEPIWDSKLRLNKE